MTEITTSRLIAASLLGLGIGLLLQAFITAFAGQPSPLNTENTTPSEVWR